MGCFSSKHDMAIGFVFFNPAESKRLLMNYLYVANLYRSCGWPIFTLELVFGDRKPEIVDAFHVYGNSYMFHKERLCRLLEKRIPKHFKKIVFLDADVIFESTEWYEETSELLEHAEVVQPFEKAHWMDLTYTKIDLTRETVLKMNGDTWDFLYHPGFAWAFQRDWYNRIGFFDWAVSGSGDTLSVAKWLHKKFPSKFQSLPKALQSKYKEYLTFTSPEIVFRRNGEIYHLYHGSRKNRQYAERHKMLEITESIQDMIEINKDGAYEWKDPKWNEVFLEYFKNRFDDAVE
jgi:hypothetical protein